MNAPAALRGRVLILEDEAVLRANMIRGLARFPGVEVLGAGSVAEALPLLDAGAPDLLISDIDLPGRLGIEMIGEVRKRGYATAIVFVSAYLKAYQAQIPPNAGVDVFEKPISLDQLRAIVEERLAPSAPPPSPFGVAEYLQIAGIGRHSVRLSVGLASGSGEILVHEGKAWSAFDPEGGGMDAFLRMANAPGATVSCTTLAGDPGPRNLAGPIESLLLEAACRQDESRQGPPPPAAPDPFGELMDRGLGHMIKKQYPQALEVFQAALALRPEDRQVLANLTRLKDLLAP